MSQATEFMEALHKSHLTFTEIRLMLEEFSSECLLKAGTVSDGHEAALLRDVAKRADEARERVIDVSIGTTLYITYCLELVENLEQ